MLQDRDEAATGAGRYGVALLAVLCALVLARAVEPFAGLENVDLVFMVAVIAVAAASGLGPALLACIASVLAYNFFFLPPLYTLAVADPKHAAALAFFLVAAVITSQLAGRLRDRSLEARHRAAVTQALYEFSREISGMGTAEDIADATARTVSRLLDGRGAVLVRDQAGRFSTTPPSCGAVHLDDVEMDALQRALEAGEGEQARAVLRLGDTYFAPMRTSHGLLGAVGITRRPEASVPGVEEEAMLQALAGQAGIAIERVRLAEERDAARLAAEAERLRSALLNSLSHDLKTPLASILGAVTALREYRGLYDEGQSDELAQTIQEEAERMGRFVTNLLDMARLEAGALAPRRQPTDIGEVIGTALRRVTSLTAHHRMEVSVDRNLPLLDIDPVLLEQAVVNLLENAAKFSPQGSRIRVEASTVKGDAGLGRTEIVVRDEGPGISPEHRHAVFDLFHQVRMEDRRPAGAGVGLAICKGFVEALGGTVLAAANPEGRGAAFVISFPESLAFPARESTS